METNLKGLQFDLFERYTTVARAILVAKDEFEEGGGTGFTVLDVGGYPGHICDFLPGVDITVLDTGELDKPFYVQGDATKLPFKDASFNVVTNMDVLEHIPPNLRRVVVSEIMRVCQDQVIISAPFKSEIVESAEALARESIKKIHGRENEWLKEHAEYGLPVLNEITGWITETGAEIAAIPMSRIDNWLLMILVNEYIVSLPEPEPIHAMVNEFYNSLSLAGSGDYPAYRHYVTAAKNGAPLPKITAAAADATKTTPAEVFVKTELFINSIELREEIEKIVRTEQGYVETLQAMVIEKDGHIVNFQTMVEEQEAIIQELIASHERLEQARRNPVWRILFKVLGI